MCTRRVLAQLTKLLISRLKHSRALWFSQLSSRSIWIRISHSELWALRKLLSIAKIFIRAIIEVRDRWSWKRLTVCAPHQISKDNTLNANHPSESFNLIKKGVKLNKCRIHSTTKCNLIGRQLLPTKRITPLRRLFVPRQNIQNLGYIKILNVSKILIWNKGAIAFHQSQIYWSLISTLTKWTGIVLKKKRVQLHQLVTSC